MEPKLKFSLRADEVASRTTTIAIRRVVSRIDPPIISDVDEHYAQCTGHRAELITSHDANPGVTLNDADETHEMVTRAEPLTIDEPNERNLSKIAHPQSVHLGCGLKAPHEN
jgi:hypothetical protein